MSIIQVTQNGQPKHTTSLVERKPVQEGAKLSRQNKKSISWEDLRGLTWILKEEEYH